MKLGRISHAFAVVLSSISSLFVYSTSSKAEPAKVKFNKKSDKLSEDRSLRINPISFFPGHSSGPPESAQRYPWKGKIVTTIFSIGEQPRGNNAVPNSSRSVEK